MPLAGGELWKLGIVTVMTDMQNMFITLIVGYTRASTIAGNVNKASVFKYQMERRIASKYVAGIDFAANSSTYVFESQTFLKVAKFNSWDRIRNKAPTCLLLRKDFLVAKFGYEARDMYSELIEDESEELEDYYFFHGLKLTFHRNMSDNRQILCKDVNGKTLKAGIVLSFCIKCLIQLIVAEMKREFTTMEEADVEFVLTVPAIWGEKGKIFMREAAAKAGVDKKCCTVVLHPEAVSIFCQYASSDWKRPLGILKPGTKYIILDIGDSVEITIHQKCEDNSLEEILSTVRGPWGKTSIENSIVNFLTELFGESVMLKMKKNYMNDFLYILDRFTENKDKGIFNAAIVRVNLPLIFSKLCNVAHNRDDLTQIIEENKFYKNDVSFKAGKLIMKRSFFRGFFKKTVDSIVKQLDELFAEEVVKDVNTIIIVGDLSENYFVEEAIRRNFEDKEVFVPDEGSISAVEGAYLFSQIPGAISRRPSQYTYGFQSWPEFIPGHHLEEKKVKIKGFVRCRDVFLKVVRKGENVMPGYTKAEILKIPNDEECLKCCLFFTDMGNTNFIDEPGCKLLGVLRLPISAINDEASCEIQVSLTFGETELEFQVINMSSGVQHKAIFDLYEH